MIVGDGIGKYRLHPSSALCRPLRSADNPPMSATRRIRGFTLVEIMVTLGVVVLLAALVTPMIVTAIQRGKEAELRTALRQIRQAVDDYRDAGNQGRIPSLPGQTAYPPTLAVLVTGVPDALDSGGRRLYFLRRVPRDPFFRNDATPPDETWGLRSSASDADRPAAGSDVYDVHSRSTGIGSNGIPYSRW